MHASLTLLLLFCHIVPIFSWRVCDVSSPEFGAVGDGSLKDTDAIRKAISSCDETVLPAGRSFLTGPLNLSSHQLLRVEGTLLASTDKADYPLVAPMIGDGWGNDENCFPPDASPHKIVVGSLSYAPVIGAYHATNVTLTGGGVINGQGQAWWYNCTRCHYPPNNDSAYCEIASRPKLVETQYVDGLRVHGRSVSMPLTLENSPFWTVTPSYSQNIHIRDLRILAPIDRIGNTDGVNLYSCRNAVVENVYINNSDDGVCMKSGLNGFGLNLAVPTENVLVRNITNDAHSGRGGFAIGSDMSGGVRNVTFRDSVLGSGPESRSIHIKPSIGRGGYITDVLFVNIVMPKGDIVFSMGTDGEPLMPDNNYVPLISNVQFVNISGPGGCILDGCQHANQSQCFDLRFSGSRPAQCSPPVPSQPFGPQSFGCKRIAHGMFGTVILPWGVCVPLHAPVNLRPDYPNWGPTSGTFSSLAACKRECV